MNHSLASYLAYHLIDKSNLTGARFYYDNKHVWDIILRTSSPRIFNATVRLANSSSYCEAYPPLCEPFHSPLQTFIKDHASFLFDPNTVDVSKFQVKALKYNNIEGENLEIDWDRPWHLEYDPEVLANFCRKEKANLPLILKEYYNRRLYTSPYENFYRILKKKRLYRDSFTVRIGSSPSFVFIKNGAIFDYIKQKILAENLDIYMRTLLEKPSDYEFTWADYCEHIVMHGIPLKFWTKFVIIKDEYIDASYNRSMWADIRKNIQKNMPFWKKDLRSRGNYNRLEVFAFDTVNSKMETYILNDNGVRRTYQESPFANNEEQVKWFQYLTKEDFQTLLDRPGTLWFARVDAYFKTSIEPVKICI
jgi:hypothetical protein